MPERMKGSWQFELPPHCVENDFTGACDDALAEYINATSAEALKTCIILYIKKHGCTHNQRQLLSDACEHVGRDEGTRMASTEDKTT